MNKQIKLLIVITTLLFTSFGSSKAQNVSTQGKEFWVSFMTNGYRTNTADTVPAWVKTQVLVSAKRSCSGIISNPNTNWSQEFTVSAGNITKIDIPEDIAYHDEIHNESVQPRGLKIVTTDTTSVYCTNIARNSFDASYVLPIHALADDYIIQCCEQSHTSQNFGSYETSAVLIVAAEDNVTVDITPSNNTLGGHAANEEFSVELQQGQSFQMRSLIGEDLSGTRVTARDCKKIAVFNGNTLTCVPVNMTSGHDQVFEQAMPLHSWGKKFVVTSSKNRKRDQVKITSSVDNNQVFKNGQLLTTLNANESFTFFITSGDVSCYLETTYPAAVFLYNDTSTDQNSSGTYGDPSMLWISPIEQRINEITFSTFNDEDAEIDDHYVNIIVKTEDIADVYFDDQQISPSSFSTVHGNSDYSCTRKDISHGVHRISCVNGFNAHVYGFGYVKGYAYMVGSNASDLSYSITINDTEVQPNGTFQYCIEEQATFLAQVNYNEYDLIWDFGDGSTSTDNPATHIYNVKDLYNAKLIAFVEGGACFDSSSDTIPFFVNVRQTYLTPINDEICHGDGYYEYGFSVPQIMNDTILGITQNNPIFPECQDSLLFYLTVKPTHNVHFDESTCWHGNPDTYSGHGFTIPYDQPGIYNDQLDLENIFGCDSIVTITLTVDNIITNTLYEQSCDSSYYWDGSTYYESGTYEKTYVSSLGCDSIVTLNLTIGYPYDVHFDESTCWNGNPDTYIQHGFEIQYDQPGIYSDSLFLESILGCDSIVSLNLTINQPNYVHFDESACWQDSPDTYTGHGFNIQYDQPGIYNDSLLLENIFGCDSIVTIALTVDNIITNTLYEQCCDSSYYWDGSTYYESGTYQKTYVSSQGCDSIVTLNLTIGQPYNVHFDESTCWNGSPDTYIEHGFEIQYDQPGFYSDSLFLESSHGCDSIVSLNLTINQPNYVHFDESACWHGSPDTYIGHGFVIPYDQPGIYNNQLDLENIFGCDSIVTIALTVDNRITNTLNENCCESSYYWDGDTYSESGTYEKTYVSSQGCDSIVTLNLTFRQPDYVHLEESACWHGIPDTYIGHGFVIQYDQPGTYSDQHDLESIYGCDSIVTIALTVDNIITNTLYEHCCENSYYWDDSPYYESGTYEKTYVSSQGCDSIVTLNLTFGHPQTYAFDTIVCSSFSWNEQEYEYSPGYHEYIQTFQTYDDCDSTVTAKVTSLEIFDDFNPIHLPGCDSLTWYGNTYYLTGQYTGRQTNPFGCDTIRHLDLHMNYTPSTQGEPGEEIYAHNTIAAHQVITATEFQICSYTYSVQDTNPYCHWDSVVWSIHTENGGDVNWNLEPFVDEDSIVWSAKLTVFNYIPGKIILKAIAYNECTQQGVTFQNWLVCSFYGVDEDGFVADIRVVPNPNNGDMDLQFLNTYGSTEVTVYDMSGTIIDKFETNTSNYHYAIKQHSTGIYLFVFNHKGKIITRKVCIY